MTIDIPNNATNGDVIKAVFDCDVTELKRMTSSAGEITVGYEVFLYNHRPKKEGEFGFGTKQKFDGTMWWNAPYKENKMKLIVDIDEQEYKDICENGYVYDEDNEYIAKIIKDGIPLPKGHGRLIDADVLVDGFEDNYEFCEEVNATPTIIEADKGE